MSPALVNQWLILLAGAVLVVALCRRLHQPPILAYLALGAVIGPAGGGLIAFSPQLDTVAEIGVVFLLFTIGLEFSLPQLRVMRREVFGLGAAQVLLTTALVTAGGWLLGLPPAEAFVCGGVLAASSTAVVVRQLAEQLELALPHGRAAVGVLLFQDLAVVPFLIVIPLLGDRGGVDAATLGLALLKGLAIFAVLLLLGGRVLRPLFAEVACARSEELFTLTVLMVALLAAALTHAAGLSSALGAFLAGVLLGETEFRHQIEATIRPFRDVLLGLFFVSVGMWLDVRDLVAHDLDILGLLLALVLGKAVLVAGLARAFGLTGADALRTGVVLAQGGEFGFVMLALARDHALIAPGTLDRVAAAVVLSLLLAPLLVRHAGTLAGALLRFDVARAQQAALADIAAASAALSEHVLICGYGRVGQNTARFLERTGFEYAAIDLDLGRVREARAAGERVGYGDAARPELLEAAGIARARVLVVSHDDARATLRTLEYVHARYPALPVLVRTRDDARLGELVAAGATEVIPETLEGSLMLISHLLALLQVGPRTILRELREVRRNRYRLLHQRYLGVGSAEDVDEELARLQAVSLPAGAHAMERSLAELALGELGVAVTALQRDGVRCADPLPEAVLRADDVLVLYGTPERLARAEARLLDGG